MIAILVAGALFLLIFFSVSFFFSPVNLQSQQEKFVVIKKGSSVSQIAQTLKSKNLIRLPLVFKLVVYKEGLNKKLQAGSFQISPAQSPQEIAHALTEGRLDIWLTVPEGWRNEQIAQEVSDTLFLEYQDFLTKASGHQGKLFPDTYLIPKDANSQNIINIMLDNYQDKLSSLKPQINSSTLTESEIINLAAIVERETLTDQEKPIVAGVLLKRLEANWPLQVDATLQYILGSENKWWPTPKAEDKKISSPYNTYKNLGLPPKPIANPGLSSIKAVLNPQPSPYWFYLHDKQGNIHYAETSQQHNTNIQKYIR